MTQPSSPGVFAFAWQQYRSNHGSYVAVPDASFYKSRATSVLMDDQEGYGGHPLEVGGGYHPSGSYKTLTMGVGDVAMEPRLENNIAYLLYALVGGINTSGTASTGVTGHITRFEPSDDVCDVPWLTTRRFIPNCTAAAREGTEFRDTRVTGAVFTIGAGAPANARFTLQAITPYYHADLNSTTWVDAAHAYEDVDSVPLAGSSVKPILAGLTGIDLGGGEGSDFSVPTTQVQVSIQNQYTSSRPQQELVVGSYYLDDMMLVSQSLTASIVYKWKEPYLARVIKRGAEDSYTFEDSVLNTAFTFDMKSPTPIATGMNPHRVRFYAPEMDFTCQPVQLAGGGFVTMRVQGQARIGATPSDTFYVELENGQQYTDLGVSYS